MNIFCNRLLANDREQANPAESGTTTKPNPVIDITTDVAVELITTTVSTDSKIVFRVSIILYFYFSLWFLSLKYVIDSFLLLIGFLKLLT